LGKVKLGLCCSRRRAFHQGPAQSSLQNAIQFWETSPEWLSGDRNLSISRLDATTENLNQSLQEAAERGVTHVFFLSPRVILPFYALERFLGMRARAVSGISWTWKTNRPGEIPEVYPRVGFFDDEGRAFPYFGWTAPDIFQADWCGLDCLLLEQKVLEEISGPLRRLGDSPPALGISQALRSQGIPIIIDSFIQCPRMFARIAEDGRQQRMLIPSLYAWQEFSRDFPNRKIPRGRVYDPSYRGREWYREWLKRCKVTLHGENSTVPESVN
jgi:hypothetical protein